MSIVWYFVALVVLIALSAFFSASEMSYSSANRLRLENAAEDGSRRARAAVGILDHYDSALSAILIGNNLVNIASSSLGSVIVILLAGEQWTWVSTVVLTLLVIIFGETMPKIVAKQNANGIALRNAYDTIPAEYRFVKNQAVAKFFGGWCFAVTAVCCVLGMYDKDPFTFALNVITPVVLTVLGFILPALAKREQTAAKK